MRRIADVAGVTAPAIYRHFDGKAEVLRALVGQANRAMASYLRRGQAQATDQRLQQTIDALIDFALEDPTSYEILFLSRGAHRRGARAPTASARPTFVGG